MFVCVLSSKALQRMLGASVVLLLGSAALICPAKARADTPAQVQKAIQAVCDHAAACTARRDLAGFMAMYAPNFMERNVGGYKENFRQVQAGAANAFARDNYPSMGHCTGSQVVPLGNQARAILRWHYTAHTLCSSSTAAYTYTRDYEEQSVWRKLPNGWHEIGAQITHDMSDYRRRRHRGISAPARRHGQNGAGGRSIRQSWSGTCPIRPGPPARHGGW